MPTLNLFTNIPVDSVIASDILKDATKAVAKIIGKPESVSALILQNAQNLILYICVAHFLFSKRGKCLCCDDYQLFDNFPL